MSREVSQYWVETDHLRKLTVINPTSFWSNKNQTHESIIATTNWNI